MKKNFMTRVLAVALSAAMALSMATATNLTVAEAAAKPAMKSASFAVRIGNKAKNYYATAATQKAYKIVKAKAGNTDKATAKVVKSGKAVAITAGTKTGKTNITLTFKNRKTAAKKTVKFAGKVLAAKVAAQEIKEIKQTAAETLEVTFAVAPTEVAASNFTITRETVNSSNQVIVVKSAVADKTDAKKVVVTVYTKLNDGAAYDVAYTAAEKTVTGKFTATDGAVAKIEVTPTTVTAGKETVLYYVTSDANGIVLDKQKIDSGADSKVEVKQNTLNGVGYITGNKIYLASVGDTMTVTATYHTYKYEGVEEVGAVTSETTITAVANASTISSVPYTVSTTAVWNWDTLTPNTTIALGDEGYALRMLIKNDDGSVITSKDEYTVESSDNGVFVVSGDVAAACEVTPVGQGSAYAIVKDNNGKVVYSLPISVVAARVVTKVVLSTTSMKVQTDSAFQTSVFANPSTTATVYDQYGKRMSGDDYDLAVKLTSNPNSSNVDKTTLCGTMVEATGNTISLKDFDFDCTTDGEKAGSYTFVVTVTDKNNGNSRQASFGVEVAKWKDAKDTLGLVLTNSYTKAITTSVNINPENAFGIPVGATTLNVNVVRKNNDLIKELYADAVSVSALRLKKNGAVIAQTGSALVSPKTCAAVVDHSAVKNNAGTDTAINGYVWEIKPVEGSGTTASPYVKNMEAGSYTVEATVHYLVNGKMTSATLSTPLTIVDDQVVPGVAVLKTKVDGQTISWDDAELFTYSYDGVELTDADGNVDKDFVVDMDVTTIPTEIKGYKDSDVFVKSKTSLTAKYMFVKMYLPNRGSTEWRCPATTDTEKGCWIIPVKKGVSFTNFDSGNAASSWTL